MDAATILTISGYAVAGGVYIVMRLKLDAVRNTALLFCQWWMTAEDKLDEIHQKHVRAGRTPHERRREQVKQVAAQIAISAPAPLRSREEIEREARAALAKRRRGKMKVAA
jgi:hypothetical protein